jgi:uncharacterized membrane protein YeaQ/YmgE (transglycosylase-associated protein family)
MRGPDEELISDLQFLPHNQMEDAPRRRLSHDALVGIALYLVLVFVLGLLVGALARLLLPGPDPMGLGLTATVGVAGSFIAGLFSWYVLHRHGVGLVLSVAFSMLLVWGIRRLRTAGGSRRTMGPGPPRG